MNFTVSFFFFLKKIHKYINALRKVSSSGKKTLITHNYGHGGSGFQSSWGSCQDAVQLIREGHASIKHDRLKIRKLFSHL